MKRILSDKKRERKRAHLDNTKIDWNIISQNGIQVFNYRVVDFAITGEVLKIQTILGFIEYMHRII